MEVVVGVVVVVVVVSVVVVVDDVVTGLAVANMSRKLGVVGLGLLKLSEGDLQVTLQVHPSRLLSSCLDS